MKKMTFHQNEQGSAILIVLGILTLVLVLGLVFVGTSRNARLISMANADNAKAALLAESAAARAEAVTYYLQEKSLDNLPAHSSINDLEYNWMPYAGNFLYDDDLTDDLDDDQHLPVKIMHLVGQGATAKERRIQNQYIFYTHDSENKQDEKNRPFADEGLLKNTKYGNYIFEAASNTQQFSDYVPGDLNSETNKRNFTYRNMLDADGHVMGRYAFLMFSEGAKFNVNQMAMASQSEYSTFVPSVDAGKVTTNANNPGVQLNQEDESTFAISGYKYDTDGDIDGLADSGKYKEKETLQYGLHPQELRVSNDVFDLADNLKLEDEDCPPQYFNYDSMLAVNEDLWTDGNTNLLDFFSLYTLYSGSDDREVVFHGNETIQECTEDSPKINLAYPGKPGGDRHTWEQISSNLNEALKGTSGTTPNTVSGFLTENFEDIFGKALKDDAEGTLFKNDAGNDITPAVFANLVDFCDEDSAVTYEAFVNTSQRLNFDTDITETTVFSNATDAALPAIAVCGNEKTPAVIAVGLELTGCDRIVTNGTVGSGQQVWSSSGTGKTDVRIRVVLQNYFNEMVDLPNKIRVVIRGKAHPWFAGSRMIGGVTSYWFFGRTQQAELPGGYNDYLADGFNFAGDAKAFVIDKTLDLSGSLDARAVDDTSVELELPAAFDAQCAQATNVLGRIERSGYWLDVRDILVMTADSGDDVMDIAYAGGSDHIVNWKRDYPNLNWNAAHPMPWAIAQDPRCNHKNWLWFDVLEAISGYDWTVTNSSNSPLGLAERNDLFGMKDELRRTALKYIQEKVCNNKKQSTAKDLEPELNFTVTGTGVVQTPNTFSTAFIPNHPITSLWQLGAVSRGEPAQTVNLKKYGGPKGGQKYADGDAWLLDYFKLNEVAPNQAIPGKFNPNCFNALSYRYLLANIPANPNPNETAVYQPGRLKDQGIDVVRNSFYYDWVEAKAGDQIVDMEDQLFKFTDELNYESTTLYGKAKDEWKLPPKQAEKQSWSPVEAFFNFVKIEDEPKYKTATAQEDSLPAGASRNANDRMAESLIGCTAGLLSTRYEYFTVFAIGQNLKYLGKLTTMNNEAFKNQLINPIELTVDGEKGWYSILATQLRLITIQRDCWKNEMKIVRNQLY